MAEIKNNFLQAKMNQDIDDRLLPNGQYRTALNMQISRSEGSNVGTLQNVLGNELVVDFRDPEITGVENLESIGYYCDENSNNIYFFLTNYTNPDGVAVYSKEANNYIYSFNTSTGDIVRLVEGAFLNFSTTNRITGVNLLENLLFWTDNRNQPRKINVLLANPQANATATYYTKEEHISVAKLNPYLPIEMYKESEIPGEYETTMYDVSNQYLPGGGGEATINVSTSSSDTFVIDDPSGSFISTGQIITGTGIPVGVKVVTYDEITFTVTASEPLTLSDGETITFGGNPYYNPDYAGDPTYLEDKFVRFSYRFRFDDGEYSIFSPFTQAAYIPKQDGYFQYFPNVNPSDEPLKDDETSALRSTIVSFMQNKVNQIKLRITLPCNGDELLEKFKITSLDILYKEDDGLAVAVVDTILTEDIAAQTGASLIYEYDYQSKSPSKTLPEKDLIRVYDRTPIKALCQEVISNRVVYSNYQDKATYPQYLDYNVRAGNKLTGGLGIGYGISAIEYPNHSLKENRNYQVGIVLSDFFGRQSGVILSNSFTTAEQDGSTFGAASLYVPYRTFDDTFSSDSWPGNSLKVLFNEVIPIDDPDESTGWPGLYNGDPDDENYNPLGWYSYKVVVKQTEQEYYNVYLPGLMAGYPEDTTEELGKTSHVVLINDNINKVPRDLSEVGPNQLQFRSSVKLYGRVMNIEPELSITANDQYYPGNSFALASTIATVNSLFNPADPLPASYNNLYQADSNPLISRISTVDQMGVSGGSIVLAVMETEPVESKLDLYWETSTAGLILELNDAILEGSLGAASLSTFSYNHDESMDIDTIITNEFWPLDIDGLPVDSIMTMTVRDLSGINRTSDFELITIPPVGPGSYNTYQIKTSSYFYYGYGASLNESYNFKFTISVGGIVSVLTRSGSLSNVAPSISLSPGSSINNPYPSGEIDICKFAAVNGSIPAGNKDKRDITFSIASQIRTSPSEEPVSNFTITNNPIYPNKRGDLQDLTQSAYGTYEITVKATDAGGAVALYGPFEVIFEA